MSDQEFEPQAGIDHDPVGLLRHRPAVVFGTRAAVLAGLVLTAGLASAMAATGSVDLLAGLVLDPNPSTCCA